MPRIPIHNVGSMGIIKDVPAHLLPPEAWSDGQNVRFKNNNVVKFTGHQDVFGTPTVVPYWAMAAGDAVNAFWLYTSLTKVYGTDGTTHADLTRAAGGDYSTTGDQLWSGGILGGIPVISNGVDDPQSWDAVGLGQKLVDLPNWPASTICRVIRPFKNYLIALNVTKSGTSSPHMVKWSHPAAAGAVPSTWDEADATKDAGENELSDAQAGVILDGMGLRDTFIIYKERSTWGMQPIVGNLIFRFFPIFTQQGILAPGCAVEYADGKHFVLSGEDIFIHNGQQMQSVLDKKWRTFLNNTLDQTNYTRSFVVLNPLEHEVWACIPQTGDDYPTLALVWNYIDNQIGVRELPGGISHIALGAIPGSESVVWDSDSEVWDDDASVWDEQTFRGFQARLLQSNKNSTALQQLDSTNQFDGSNITSFIQRDGLAVVGVDRQGNPKADFEIRKLVKRLWPKLTGGPVNVRVGTQESLDGTITWQATQAFDPATQKYLDVMANGRLISVRFESNTNVGWGLQGYDLEVEPLGGL